MVMRAVHQYQYPYQYRFWLCLGIRIGAENGGPIIDRSIDGWMDRSIVLLSWPQSKSCRRNEIAEMEVGRPAFHRRNWIMHLIAASTPLHSTPRNLLFGQLLRGGFVSGSAYIMCMCSRRDHGFTSHFALPQIRT